MTSIFKTISLIIIGAIILLGMLGIYVWSLFQPVSSSTQTVNFVVPKGQAISIIGQRLEDAGLIKNALVFRYVVKRDRLENQIQAGSFEIAPNMGVSQVALVLTKGTNDIWITIVEGWRKEEIAEMLSRQDLPDFDKEEFINLAKNDEGHLYPDTYLISKLSSTSLIYNLLIDTFEKKVTQKFSKEMSSSSYTPDEIITIASILEREANRGEETDITELRTVAGILYNRLQIGMPLQVDATLEYVKGYNQATNDWWQKASAEDKKLKSPYNTYLNPGLPPGPISNPGEAAITAALNPIDSDYLYYLHDLKGQIHYGLTLDEHNQNVEKYLR